MSKLIIGVDEVGVGSIAGPLVVAAVVFTVDTPQPILSVHRGKRWRQLPVCDSKKVQHDLLPAFRTLILDQCLTSALAYKFSHEVDALGVAHLLHHLRHPLVAAADVDVHRGPRLARQQASPSQRSRRRTSNVATR